jgi:hypothetical protein
MPASTDTDTNTPPPRVRASDWSALRNRVLLGEQLEVLFRALLRLEFATERDGMATFTARLPFADAHALVRAMDRVAAVEPDDDRTEGQRRCDHFLKLAGQILLACDVAIAQATGRAAPSPLLTTRTRGHTPARAAPRARRR